MRAQWLEAWGQAKGHVKAEENRRKGLKVLVAMPELPALPPVAELALIPEIVLRLGCLGPHVLWDLGGLEA